MIFLPDEQDFRFIFNIKLEPVTVVYEDIVVSSKDLMLLNFMEGGKNNLSNFFFYTDSDWVDIERNIHFERQ